MDATQLLTFFHIFGTIVFFILLVVSLSQRGFDTPISRLLAVFLGVMLILELVQIANGAGRLIRLPESFTGHISFYSVFVSVVLLFHISALFLHVQIKHGLWLVFQVVWIAATVVLDLNAIVLSETWPQNLALSFDAAIDALLIGGWGLLMVSIFMLTIKSYRTEQNLLMRSRIVYWALSLVLILGGNILLFWEQELLGVVLEWLGVIVIVAIVVTPHLPDIRETIRRILSNFIVAILELSIYTLGFYGIQYYFEDFSGYDPLFVGIALAAGLLFLFNPLLKIIQKWVTRWIVGETKDHSQILREYSKGISNILDLKLLATVVVGLISELLEVSSGGIFMVENELGEDGKLRYRLKGVKGMGETNPVQGLFALDSPISVTFEKEAKPITQTEVDMLPKFKNIAGEEKSWLKHQNMELFIPIHSKNEWIGLLALGAKNSGSSFTKADIDLLETLADQTAVALQNAKLVESLVRVNNEFKRAYSAMEDAHAKLERLDRTKSDFISISSHELRTPLTVINGYSQMLMDDPTFADNPYYKKAITGIYEGTTRLHEIVDSMLEIAKIDTKALELQAESVSMPTLIRSVSAGFSNAFKDRNQTIVIDPMNEMPKVQGDPEALNKVFYHLISNAIKYTPDNGKIVISGFTLQKGDPKYPPGGVEIIISDTGIGIDPRYKELIFAKFYQTGELSLHSSGKTKFKGGGPGLGLAIVRGIVEAHGGRVWAESQGYDEEKCPGSHFHVILPTSLEEVF